MAAMTFPLSAPTRGIEGDQRAAATIGVEAVTPAGPRASKPHDARAHRIHRIPENTMTRFAKFVIAGLVLALFVTAIAPTWPLELAAGLGGGLIGLVGVVIGAIAALFALLVVGAVLVCVGPAVLIALLLAALVVVAAMLLTLLLVAVPVLLPILALVWFVVWLAKRPVPPRPSALPVPRAA
jgi:hypothetical protein